jgi:hypothetical protein
MHLLTVTLFNSITIPVWALWVALAVVILGIVALIWIQCIRVANRKLHTVPATPPTEGPQAVTQAIADIREGLLLHLRAELGAQIPDDKKSIYRFMIENYAERNTGPYISIEAFVPFLRGKPYLYLQGSDTVGGVSVLPIRVSESGERNFYLEGLTVAYRNGDQHITTKFNIRFASSNVGAPIEEVLEFEFEKKHTK